MRRSLVGAGMALAPHNQQSLDDFFTSIAPATGAYHSPLFAYIAVKRADHFVLLQGRTFLNTGPSTTPSRRFESKNITAERISISELNLDTRTFVECLFEGKLSTPHGDLIFPKSEGGLYSTTYISLHPDGLQNQQRYEVLRISGGQVELPSQPSLDWELKASFTPFDGLHELMSEFGLGTLGGLTANVEVIAFNISVIDAAKSFVNGETATVHVLLAKGLECSKFTLGYRAYKPGSLPERSVVSGEAINWTEEEFRYRGVTSIQVPSGSVVNCVAIYGGIAQSHWWLFDPTRLQNSRRAVYEAFDNKLEIVRDIVAKALRKGDEARDLEAALSWILWMLGFSVAQLGGTRRTQDAADLIATSPNGHFAVIECTTGLLKADNKLALLYERALVVKRSLSTSDHNHLRVLPVLITSKIREDIKADIEQAERLGILVLTREDIISALDRTLQLPAADQIYDEGFQSVLTALAKHEAQPPLPLPPGN